MEMRMERFLCTGCGKQYFVRKADIPAGFSRGSLHIEKCQLCPKRAVIMKFGSKARMVFYEVACSVSMQTQRDLYEQYKRRFDWTTVAIIKSNSNGVKDLSMFLKLTKLLNQRKVDGIFLSHPEGFNGEWNELLANYANKIKTFNWDVELVTPKSVYRSYYRHQYDVLNKS